MATSSKSTSNGSETPPSATLFQLDETPSEIDEALDAVQRELTAQIDARREERFVWMCVVIMVFDIFTFKDMQTWAGPLVIGLIQVIFIIAVGRKWGMDHIWTITEKLVDKWDGKMVGRG